MAKWTEDEISVLKEKGHNLLSQELAAFLPVRSKRAIGTMCFRLGISKSDECMKRKLEINRSNINYCGFAKLDQKLGLDDLDNTTFQILIGSILGDGCIKRNNSGMTNGKRYVPRNYCFYEGHGVEQAEYVRWKHDKLKIFQPVFMNKHRPELLTKSHCVFTELRTMFYGNDNKKNNIPLELVSKLDYLGLLIWYLDDGYLGTTRSGFIGNNKYKNHASPSISAKLLQQSLSQTVEIINYNLGLFLYLTRDGCTIKFGSKSRDVVFPIWQKLAQEHKLATCMNYKLEDHK